MNKLTKRRIRLILNVVALVAIGALLSRAPANADQAGPLSDISLRQIRLGDQTAYGYVPTVEIWFPGYGDYELEEGSYLQLEYDHSALLHSDDSTITVLLNDIPVSSAFLTADTTNRTSWRVSLPRDKLRRDINRVSVKYYMHISHDDCALGNPSLYSNVYDSSFIHYEYASPLRPIALPPPNLARFPEPFIRPTAPTSEVAIVLPDNASSVDFSAAATVAARLGQLSASKPVTATLQFASELGQSQLAQRDLVVIGQPDSNPLLGVLSPSLPLKIRRGARAVGWVDESGSLVEPEHGVLQEIASPWNAHRTVLVVSGGSEEGLRRAVRTVGSRLGMKPLQGQYAIVTEASEALTRGESPTDGNLPLDITLRQIGLTNVTVSGIGSHTVGFSFDSPPPDSGGGAYFDLVMSYSPVIDSEKSSAKVSLNGIPVSSIVLRKEGSDRSRHRIPLPATNVKPGINSIAVTFFLYMPRSQECGVLAPEQAWAVLDPDSRVVLTAGSEQPSLDLANLPYPFLQNGTPSGTYLALPDGGTALQDSLQVAVAFGRQALGENTELQAGLAAELSDEVKRSYHLIAYGSPSDNPLVAEVGQKLPLLLGSEGQRTLQRSELPLLGIRDKARLGIIQLIKSPWSADKGLLVVTGTSAESARKAAPVLQNRLPAGNVAIVDDDGAVAGLTIAEKVERRKEGDLLQGRAYAFAAIPLAAAIVGLVGLMLVRVVRQPRQAS